MEVGGFAQVFHVRVQGLKVAFSLKPAQNEQVICRKTSNDTCRCDVLASSGELVAYHMGGKVWLVFLCNGVRVLSVRVAW
jgi:hypothetical protein